MTNEELLFICDALQKVTLYYQQWQQAYRYNPTNNEFESIVNKETIDQDVKQWFFWSKRQAIISCLIPRTVRLLTALYNGG